MGTARRWSRIGTPAKVAAPPKPAGPPPSVLEAELRERLQKICRQVDVVYFRCKWGEANKRVAKTFGKSRAEMNLSQLQQVEKWRGVLLPVIEMRQVGATSTCRLTFCRC